MGFKIDLRALAQDIGVADIKFGNTTPVPNGNIGDVVRILREHDLKVLGFYNPGFRPESNTLYFSVDGEIVGAKYWEKSEKNVPLIKPESYKD